MDAKITKTRLAQMLSYDWLKIVGGALAVIFVWLLIFTWTATRITATQQYVIHNYFGVSLGNGFYDDYANFVKGKVFSYEVFELESVDVNQDDTVGYQLLETRWAVGEADALFIADYDDTRTYYDAEGNVLSEVGENTEYFYKSYLETFARSSYFYSTVRLDDGEGKDGLLTQMKMYLSQFYEVTSETEKTFGGVTLSVADFDESSLDEELVKQKFKERATANKDKRYKKDAEWAQGYADEIARIESYQAAYEAFFSYLEGGYIALNSWEYEVENAAYTKGGAYSINLCPDEESMPTLKEDFYYRRQTEDGKYYTTAKDMNVLFVELDGLDPDFKYENILLVNEIVRRHAVGL